MVKGEFIFQQKYNVIRTGDSLLIESLEIPNTTVTIFRRLPDVTIYYEDRLITGRDCKHYTKDRDIPVRKGVQYVEVGPGLGEFVPYVVKEQGYRPQPKPIVIERADYQTIKEMLLIAVFRNDVDKYFKDLINELIKRIAIYTNTNFVTLYNMSFEEAMEKYRDRLIGSADYVVNSFGPYSERTNELERLLYKNI